MQANQGAGDHMDLEMGNSANYPMVLVQIPIYNEKEVLFLFFLLPISSSSCDFVLISSLFAVGVFPFWGRYEQVNAASHGHPIRSLSMCLMIPTTQLSIKVLIMV